MRRFGIKRRCFTRPDISRELLENLYQKEKLSMPKIAKMLNTTYDTIWRKMRKYSIKVRSMSEAKMKYHKSSFSGNLIEKAYMLGLRAGDFSAARACKQITINTSSTHIAQLNMFKCTFEKYSKVDFYKVYIKTDCREAWHIYCRLDSSFEFLLKKPNRIPKWVLENERYFYSFLAGYADCEACWYLHKQKESKNFKSRFQIVSGDVTILRQINAKLLELGLRSRFRLAYKKEKGHENSFGKYNKDMYCLNINFQEDIRKLATILLSLSSHQEKIWKMKFILENINKGWMDVCQRLQEFKKFIDETNLNKTSKELRYLHYATKASDVSAQEILSPDCRQ